MSTNGHRIFTREDILAAKEKRNVIRIDDVPGLSGSVYVRELKRSEFQVWLGKAADSDARTIAEVLCDESGALLFNPESEDDIKSLEDCLTARQLAHIGTRTLIENSANPQVAEKNLQASLSMPSNSA